MPAVPKRRGWFDKEFAEYEIAAIVSAVITRGAILSTSDPFTILVIRSTESPPESTELRARWREYKCSIAELRHIADRNDAQRWCSPVRENPAINTDKLSRPFHVPSHPSSGYGHTSGNECATLEMHQRAVIFVIPMSAAGISAGVPTSVPREGKKKERKRVKDCPIIR